MALAGEIIDAADINALNTYYAIKGSDESVTSVAAVQNDDDLSASLAVGIWLVEAHLFATGAQAADVIVAWAVTGTVTCLARSILAPSSTNNDASGATAQGLRFQQITNTLTTNYRVGTDATNTSYWIERLILDVDAASTLQLQWAQGTSTGSATTMKSGSHLTWRGLTAG